MPQRFDRLLLVLPGWVAFVLYLPTLSNGFVWDDTYFLTELPLLRDAELWWGQISEPLFVSRNYFRPLALAMFALEARVGGLDPFLFHLVNVGLHAANATLVVVLARMASPVRAVGPAAAAGLMFAVHPAIVENVAWISDRFDLAMVFFLLLAMACDALPLRTIFRALAAAVLFLFALLSKETAVVLLALLPLWQALLRVSGAKPLSPPQRLWTRADITVWAALVLALIAYLAMRHAALGYFYVSDSMIAAGSGLQRVLLVGKTLGWYLALTVWPFGQMLPVHPARTPVAVDDLLAWAGLGATLAVCVMLVVAAWRARWARGPALAAGMALVALAPVSNLVPLTIGDNLVHDRYLILPVAFLAIASSLTWKTWRPFSPAAVVAGSWALASVIAVSILVPRWESNLSLWGWAFAREPESRIASENYVAALVNANRNEETIAVARSLLARGPELPGATHNLALALARLGRYDEAERVVRRAIDLHAGIDSKVHLDLSEAYNLLGYICLRQGRFGEAEQALRRSIVLTPYLTRPHYNLAMLHYEQGNWEEGDRELAFAVRYGAPELAAAHQRLGSEKKQERQAQRG